MSKKRGTDMFTDQKVDRLFSEFVREMDEQTTNGIVKKLDPEKIDPMVDHFLGQCDHFSEKVELRDQIEIFLSAKFDYALAEERVCISDHVERNIREKIKDVLREHMNNAGKFAGFVLNWVVIKPVKFFKTAVEPVVANTVLTYSLAVHPPYLDSVEIQYLKAVKPFQSITNENTYSTETPSKNIKELETVKKYSEDDLVNLTQNTVQDYGLYREKQIKPSQKIKPNSSPLNTTLSQENTGSQKVYVDVQRRIIERSPISSDIESSGVHVQRFSGELRPIGDVQRIIAQNDHRIYSCFNIYKKSNEIKNGRISMKFQITSKGMVKDVKVTYNSFNQELADRVILQMKTVRFSEIEGKLGEQTVYHTFYF
jgi:hypothetical protein